MTASFARSTVAMEQCIQECLNCYALCTSTAAHCLEMGGHHAERKHQAVMLDCADACRRCAESCTRMASMAA